MGEADDSSGGGGGGAAPPLDSARRLQRARAPAGYRGFGSFMSEVSVEEMVGDPAWQTPPNPCAAAAEHELTALAGVAAAAAAAGEAPPSPASPRPLLLLPFPSAAQLRPRFLVDCETWTFLNHGAFGGVLRAAHLEAAAWRERCERQPLAFLDRCGGARFLSERAVLGREGG